MRAGVPRRAAAALIDGVLYAAVFFGRPLPVTYSSDGPADTIVAAIITVVLAWIYEAGMQSGRQQATVGKMALAIVVTDTAGGRMTFRVASRRFAAKLLSVPTLGAGFLMAAVTRRGQALHDLIAGTLVVNRDALPADRRPDRP